MSGVIPIGQLSRKTGVKVPTIRYYEGVGLLPQPSRSKVIGASTGRPQLIACASSAMHGS